MEHPLSYSTHRMRELGLGSTEVCRDFGSLALLVHHACGQRHQRKLSEKGVRVLTVASWAEQQRNGTSQEDVGGALILSALSSCDHFYPSFF